MNERKRERRERGGGEQQEGDRGTLVVADSAHPTEKGYCLLGASLAFPMFPFGCLCGNREAERDVRLTVDVILAVSDCRIRR